MHHPIGWQCPLASGRCSLLGRGLQIRLFFFFAYGGGGGVNFIHKPGLQFLVPGRGNAVLYILYLSEIGTKGVSSASCVRVYLSDMLFPVAILSRPLLPARLWPWL